MTQSIIKPTRLAALLLVVSLGVSACSAPSGPVGSSDNSFGTLAANMADYYYPTTGGKTYIYKNTITEYNNGGNKVAETYVGGYDTVRLLGHQGFNAPDGSPISAFSVTYRVTADRNNKNSFPLYYVKKGNSNNGGFIVGNDPTGMSNVASLNVVTAAIDTILYAVEGPIRDIIDGPGTKSYRTDKIYYTANADHVNIWWVENGAIRKTRLCWDGDFTKNDEWNYAIAVGDPYTYWSVKNPDTQVTTPAGTFTTAQIEVFTENLNTSTAEYKWWGRNTGLVKQYDEWRVTSDGSDFRKKTKVRELISIQ